MEIDVGAYAFGLAFGLMAAVDCFAHRIYHGRDMQSHDDLAQ